MDNDLKIIKPEVKLFLGDQLLQSNINSVTTYDLEKEYAKTRHNRHLLPISILAITALVIILFSFLFTRYIKKQDERITVSVEAFDDLNLKKLLDSVSRIQNELNISIKEKKSIEDTYAADTEKVIQDRDAELYTLKSMNLPYQDYNKQSVAIVNQYRRSLAFLEATYEKDLSAIEKKISDLSGQLAAMDSVNLARAQEQQAELDAQKQVFNLEKQQLIDKYEASIALLKTEIQGQKQRALEERNRAIDRVAATYQAKINSLDPVINDAQADKILQEAQLLASVKAPDFSKLAGRADLSERDTFLLNSLLRKYQYQEYLCRYIISLPHKNTIPQYSNALRIFGKSMSDDTIQFIDNMITARSNAQKTTVTLETLIDSYSYFIDLQLKATGDSGFVIDPRKASAVVVHISPLYKNEISNTTAYVFRKADEFIGTVTLKKKGAKIIAEPFNSGMIMLPGDRILIDYN